MQIFDIFEAEQSRKLVVTYPGRFQPFHQGHAEVFQSLQSKFGSDNVYIVSADKVEQPKSPFSFSDKVQFMRAAGIPAHSIIQANKVYDLPDQFQSEKDRTVYIAVVGEPDAKRLGAGGTKKDGSPSYFQPWPGDFKEAQTADKHGYVIVEPERPKVIKIGGNQVDVSHGTPVRALWNEIKNKPELRKEFITQMYGQYHAELEPILDKIAEGAELNEISLGNYYSKANKNRMQNISKTIFADPANPEVQAAKRAIANRERGIQRMTTRNQKAFKAGQLQQQQQQQADDAANLDQLEAKLAELEKVFDKHYEYSDDHRVWTKHRNIADQIANIKRRIQNARIGLDEEAAGVGVVKNGKDPRYMTATMGDDNKVTVNTLPQMMKNYNLIPGKKKTLESKDDLRLHLKRNRFKAIQQRKAEEEQRLKKAMQSVATEVDTDPTDNIDRAMQDYLDRGGKVELLPYKRPRAADRMNWGSKHIGGGGDKMRPSRTGMASMPIGKPVVAVENVIVKNIIAEHRHVLAQHGPGAILEAARQIADYVGPIDYIDELDGQVFTIQTIRNLNRNLYEGMFEFNKKDPYNSEFAPDVGMGRMTLRGWKQSLAQRLQELNNFVQEATKEGNIDKAMLWENIYKKMQNLNLEPVAKEIELAHAQLEVIRRQGGVRSRAFQLQEMHVTRLQENWKKKLAALGLAGAIGMGAAAPAQADWIDDVMEPVHKVNKVVRDVQNFGRNTGEKIHYYKDKVGRNIEQVPIPGAERYGRELRGDVPPPLVDTSPEAEENARRNAEMNREEQRLRQQRQQQHQQQMQQVPERPWYDKY